MHPIILMVVLVAIDGLYKTLKHETGDRWPRDTRPWIYVTAWALLFPVAQMLSALPEPHLIWSIPLMWGLVGQVMLRTAHCVVGSGPAPIDT